MKSGEILKDRGLRFYKNAVELYLPSTFFKDQIEDMINFVQELIDIIEKKWDILIYYWKDLRREKNI